MNISIMDVLTLEDKNEYVVVSKVLYEDKNYMFLVDINNNKNIIKLKSCKSQHAKKEC